MELMKVMIYSGVWDIMESSLVLKLERMLDSDGEKETSLEI